MSKKIGPYGSHYGTGCYTVNCRLMSASLNGVEAPLTFSEANDILADAFSRGMTAKGRFALKSAKEDVDDAHRAVNATPEGIKALTKQISEAKKTYGKDHVLVLSKETALQEAKNRNLRETVAFKVGVFDSIQDPVEPRDLKHLVAGNTRFQYDEDKEAIVDALSRGQVWVGLGNGSELTADNQRASYSTDPVKLSEYNHVKKLIGDVLIDDVEQKISTSPTPTSRIKETLKSSYKVEAKRLQDGSTETVVRQKRTLRPLVRIKYDSYGDFVESSWASSSGNGSLQSTGNPHEVLSLIKTGKIKNFPDLPSYAVN